jgi:DNA-binding transcriptional LysR family regulator
VHGNFRANNGHSIREALLAGAGVALMPDWLVHEEIVRGRLAVLLPQFTPAPLEVNAVYPSGRHVSAKLRTFVDFLQERFKAIPAFSARGLKDSAPLLPGVDAPKSESAAESS